MLTRCATCSGWRTSGEHGRALADGSPASRAGATAFVRIRPRAALRRHAVEGEALWRLSASGLAAVGSRSPRPSSPRTALRAAAGPLEIALVPITTAGDRDRSSPFGEIGARGVFVKELEEALLEGRIDVAVHSAKDMTSTDAEGLSVGAYLQREDPRDALCGADELRPGMRIGTASTRRRAQLLALEPDLLDRAAARQHRHASAQARRARARRDRPRCVRARPARALGGEAGHRFDPTSCCRRRGRERWRFRFGRARKQLVGRRTMQRRAAASRPSARASARSAAAASRRLRPTTTARA